MPRSILIIDDSSDTRELFAATLEFEGFAVETAKDGEDALRILRKSTNFSLILLDLKMPIMSGIELLETMNREQIGSNIPVILISGVENLASLSLPKNVVDRLKKPFFYPELLYKIRKLHSDQSDKASTNKKNNERWL